MSDVLFPIDQPEHEEPMTLNDVLRKVDISVAMSEGIANSYLTKPTDENSTQYLDSLVVVTSTIGEAVTFVLTNEEYTDEEKPGITASIIRQDRQRRVTFLQELGVYSEQDVTGDFSDFEDLKESLYKDYLAAKETPFVVVEGVMDSYTELLNIDISTFLNSDLITKRKNSIERRQNIFKQASQIGAVLLASAAGTSLAMLFNRKRS